jgi:hypothetical protein
MALGIRQMLALGGSLVFALPLGLFAIEQLIAGERLVGGLLLVVAVLMVWLPQYLTTPDDIPGKVADKALGRALPEEDADTEE